MAGLQIPFHAQCPRPWQPWSCGHPSLGARDSECPHSPWHLSHLSLPLEGATSASKRTDTWRRWSPAESPGHQLSPPLSLRRQLGAHTRWGRMGAGLRERESRSGRGRGLEQSTQHLLLALGSSLNSDVADETSCSGLKRFATGI